MPTQLLVLNLERYNADIDELEDQGYITINREKKSIICNNCDQNNSKNVKKQAIDNKALMIDHINQAKQKRYYQQQI